MRLLSSSVIALLTVLPSVAAPQQPTAPPRPTVLITASVENVTSTSTTGAATKVGGVVVGGASAKTSTFDHSEVWEVVRRFSAECPAAVFVVNPDTPHTMTIHVEFEKMDSLVLGPVNLYQLALLDTTSNPLYVSKKDWLRKEIKPLCKVIH